MRPIAWAGIRVPRFELAFVDLGGEGLSARGTQLGTTYRLAYEVVTDASFVTERFIAECETREGSKRIELRRGSELSPEVLDVDLGYSPLFNTLPVLRDRLLEGGPTREYTMAFVDVPALDVSPSQQEYTPVEHGVVRYRAGTFAADLVFDRDGFVRDYPQLARRLGRT